MLAHVIVFAGCLIFAAVMLIGRARFEQRRALAGAPPSISSVWFAGSASSAGSAEEAGTQHRFPAEAGTTVLKQFRSGVDSVQIDLTDVEGELCFDLASSGAAPSIAFSIGSGLVMTLRFDGLARVPTADIRVIARTDGADISCMELNDLLESPKLSALYQR